MGVGEGGPGGRHEQSITDQTYNWQGMPVPSGMMSAVSLWPRLADLPLVVDGSSSARLEPGPGFGEAHTTRLVRLIGRRGGGAERGHHAVHGRGAPDLPLAGEWTLGELLRPPRPRSDAVAGRAAGMGAWRAGGATGATSRPRSISRCAQAGRPLHEVLGREPRPVTFVNSLGLGDPPSVDTILRRLERYPRAALQARRRAATGRRRSSTRWSAPARSTRSTSRASYGMEVEDPAALAADCTSGSSTPSPTRCSRIRTTCRRSRALVDAARRRACPTTRRSTPSPTSTPSRSAPGRSTSSRAASARCATCSRSTPRARSAGSRMYGGGMGELGVARGQVQLLASLFSPDGAQRHRAARLQRARSGAGLPVSPLAPAPAATGFRREG